MLVSLNKSLSFHSKSSPFVRACASPSVPPGDATGQPIAPSHTPVRTVGGNMQNLGAHNLKRCSQLLTDSIIAPIHVDKLSELLIGSDYPTADTYGLVNGFRNGFCIPFCGVLPQLSPCNHPSVNSNSHIVSDMLKSEISLGRIAGPFLLPPFDDFVVSPLGLVPKRESGSFRLIHDLSFPRGDSINSGIPREFSNVSYEDFDFFLSLLAMVGCNCFIAKADIESAFRIVPIDPNCHHLLGFMFNDKYYYDKCLPMGCSISCKLFEDFSRAIQWVLDLL